MERTIYQEASLEQAVDLGLRPEEFKMIVDSLGRTPSLIELIYFSIVGSELNFANSKAVENFLVHEDVLGMAIQKFGLDDEESFMSGNEMNSVSQEKLRNQITESIKQPDDLKEAAIKMLQLMSSKNLNLDSKQDQLASARLISLTGLSEQLLHDVKANENFIAEPEQSFVIAVADGVRKIVCSGAVPTAIVTSINLNDSQEVQVKTQLINALKGLSEASAKFRTPLKATYLDFEAQDKDVSTTLGVVGEVSAGGQLMTMNFKQKGDLIFILGESTDDVASSVYLSTFHNVQNPLLPYFDLSKELALHETVSGLIQNSLVNAVHDVSSGGLFFTLVEMSIPGELGFDIVTDSEVREDSFLFGEGKGRVIVSVNEDQEEEFIEFMMNSGVNFTLLGHVTKGKMMVDDEHFGFVAEVKQLYNS